MLHALCMIAFGVLFSGGPVRLCCIFVKFSGFVVIGVCHVGSISSAPSAHQHAGLQPVPKVTEWCDEDLQDVRTFECGLCNYTGTMRLDDPQQVRSAVASFLKHTMDSKGSNRLGSVGRRENKSRE